MVEERRKRSKEIKGREKKKEKTKQRKTKREGCHLFQIVMHQTRLHTTRTPLLLLFLVPPRCPRPAYLFSIHHRVTVEKRLKKRRKRKKLNLIHPLICRKRLCHTHPPLLPASFRLLRRHHHPHSFLDPLVNEKTLKKKRKRKKKRHRKRQKKKRDGYHLIHLLIRQNRLHHTRTPLLLPALGLLCRPLLAYLHTFCHHVMAEKKWNKKEKKKKRKESR
mmetsp:Transcript_45690/g.118091  ORF Transcript_45690/g.118091 Transcript_45690/m.118091 type:complete len:219 (+) Transcript_45690:1129-1785(+)